MSTLADRKKLAEDRLAKSSAALTPELLAEIELRAQIVDLENKAKEAEQQRRNLELDRRLDTAKETLGEDARLSAISIDGFPDAFVIQYTPSAHSRWTEDIAKKGDKTDRAKVNRAYAVAVVYDWNGEIGGDDPEFTLKLDKYLTANPGIVTPITNEAANLAGVFATDRKS